MMRTPGNDSSFAAGFLLTEGLVDGRDEIRRVAYCEDLPADEQHYNVVTVSLARRFDAEVLGRHFFANSSCGSAGRRRSSRSRSGASASPPVRS